MDLAAGQTWTYRAPRGFEGSRMIIGALVAFADSPTIVCCAVTGAPRRLPDGTVDTVTIPFLPINEPAFRDSVVSLDGITGIDSAFAGAFADWQSDARGLSAFTVPFDGYLDRLIAAQMAALVRDETEAAP
jgi:hypothetical protein